MIIQGKSIRNVDRYVSKLSTGERFRIAVRDIENYEHKLLVYGIDITQLEEGESFLPRPIKSATKYNANGKVLVDKSEKENRVFEKSYHNVDWHGKDHYGTYYQYRLCYKRKLLDPLEIELIYYNGFIISPVLENSDENKNVIKHVINIFLEIFGSCEILTEGLNFKASNKIKRLQWTVLPKGKYPWNKAKAHLDIVLNSTPIKYKRVITNRHEVISNKIPDFMAIGDQGFYGYVIYGFTKKNIYIFESNQTDNATYVFKGNWEDASKLTKLEILNSKMHEARVVHNKNWKDKIDKIIG